MVKAVIFDMDGTVLDTLPDLHVCMNTALKQFDCPLITMEQTRAYIGHGGLYFARCSLPEEKKEQAEYFYKEYYNKVHFACKNELTKVFPGEEECLKALQASGKQLAIVTNKSQPAADALRNHQLKEFAFDVVFGNRDGVPTKPDPTSTLLVLNKLGVNADEAVFVGDGDTDVQTARNAGMRCISVLWGYRTKEQLIEVGADCFAETFSRLKEMILSM